MTVPIAWRPVAALVAMALVASCGTETEPAPMPKPPKPAAVLLTVPDSLLARGDTSTFVATLVDLAGDPIPGASYAWTSEYPGIATVSADGLVRGVDVGDARITATSQGLHASAWVSVRDTVIATRLQQYGSPFGLAAKGGKAIVTLLDSSAGKWIALPGFTMAGRSPTVNLPTAAAFNPTGTKAYVVGIGGTLTVLDAGTFATLQSVPMPGALSAVLPSLDGSVLWIADADYDRVVAVNVATLQPADTGPAPRGPNWIAQHPTLPRVYVNGTAGEAVYELDAATLDSLRAWKVGGVPQGMAVSRDGTRLFVANELGWMDVIDLGTGAVATRVSFPEGAFGLALSPDGSRIALSMSFGKVRMISAATLSTIQNYVVGGTARRIVYTDDGTHVLVANELGWVDYLR